TAVASASELPADTEAVLVFVVNAVQTEDVLLGPQGCLAKLAKGAVGLCSATVAPGAARGLASEVGAAGVLMLDAPGSGGAGRGQGRRAGREDDGDGIGLRGGVRQGAAGAGGDLHQGMAAGRPGWRRQHSEDGEPVACGRAYCNRGRGAGAGYPGWRRSPYA